MARPSPRPVPDASVPQSSVQPSIWELPEQGERGPRARYSRATIAAAAVALADTAGLDAVTMRRMAAELGLGTMSLYNYVPTKDHLVQLMIDQVSGEYHYPAGPPPVTQQAIVDLARQGRDITQRHPWLPRALSTRPPAMGPATLRYIDYFLGLLSGTSLDTGRKMELLALVNGFAVNYGGMQARLAEERARTGVTVEQQAAAQVSQLVAAAASGRYPSLAAALAAPAPPDRDADEIFDSCISRLIDGYLSP
ncbi:MAG TPA: TetR/AcrR family transcriptional regulator [Streptosporangiaceae bacterium]|nr:TetR/AcrR family transcriptional regulator [Streptosporangiaceae bacterium]